ncbi:SDR family NAD(P)-dependent oxidoreductase [Falsiroseomonas sp. HC035]|uniref:SDR family NAD(P)-dependent oxidoreductase n=1 Tax=Falsiroseomonas sp. HC035 TaxID=3390999 RepID=UPI003D31B7D4
MELGLKGRTALVTGASLGIGLAIARELAAEGVAVAMVARDAERLAKAAAAIAAETGGRTVPVAADLVDAAQLDSAVAQAEAALGRIDILVNNAGATPMGRIAESDDATWRKSLDLKLMGYMRCARLLVPGMRARRWGRVVNIIGRSGHQPRATYIVGSSVNAALLSFTHALAQDCAPDNVLVVGVNPGPIATPRWDALVAQGAAGSGRDPDAENAAAIGSVALGRLGTVEEVSGLVAFLCSDRAGFITGTNIDIDGGGTRCI